MVYCTNLIKKNLLFIPQKTRGMLLKRNMGFFYDILKKMSDDAFFSFLTPAGSLTLITSLMRGVLVIMDKHSK